MNTYITTKEELKELIQDATRVAFLNAIPELLKDTKPKYLNRAQVLKMLNVSMPTLQRLRNARRIPFIQIDRKILYPYAGIVAYLESHHIKVVGE